jgi:hypothetical protein
VSHLVQVEHTLNLLHVLVTIVTILVTHVAVELMIVVILVTQIIFIETPVFPLV